MTTQTHNNNFFSNPTIGPQLVNASSKQNSGVVAIAAITSMIALINDNIEFSSFMMQNQTNMGQINANAATISSQNTIQNEEKQIQEQQKAAHRSFFAKLFGGILLALTSLMTIFSGGIATGLLMAVIGGIAMSGAMSSTGAIGKLLDKVATDLCKLIPGVSQTAMQAIVETLFVTVLTLGAGAVGGLETGATDAVEEAEEAVEKAVEDVTEDASKSNSGNKPDSGSNADQSTKSLASKAWDSLKETFGTKKAFAMLTVGSQTLLSTNTIQDITNAIVSACEKGGNQKKAEKIAMAISIVIQVLVMVCTMAAGAGGAAGEAGTSAASIYTQQLLKVLPYATTAAQLANSGVGLSQGANSLKISDTTKTLSVWQGLSTELDALLQMNQSSMGVTSSYQTSLTNTLQQVTQALNIIPSGQQAVANALAS